MRFHRALAIRVFGGDRCVPMGKVPEPIGTVMAEGECSPGTHRCTVSILKMKLWRLSRTV